MTGLRVNKLAVLGRSAKKRVSGLVVWTCRCDCGTLVDVEGSRLRGEKAQVSCGCETARLISESQKTHGMTKTPEYKAWRAMQDRCSDPKNKNYEGRGIAVHPSWTGPGGFEAFLEHIGPRPASNRRRYYSIDRKNNDGNYEPGNVRWSTPQKQGRNRRSNRILTIKGVSKTIAEWAEESGIKPHSIARRIDAYGWRPEDAVAAPVDSRKSERISRALRRYWAARKSKKV